MISAHVGCSIYMSITIGAFVYILGVLCMYARLHIHLGLVSLTPQIARPGPMVNVLF